MFANHVSDLLMQYVVKRDLTFLAKAITVIEDEIQNPSFSSGKIRTGLSTAEIEAVFMRSEPLKLLPRDAVDGPFTATIDGEIAENKFVRIIARDTDEEQEAVVARLTYRTPAVLVLTPITL